MEVIHEELEPSSSKSGVDSHGSPHARNWDERMVPGPGRIALEGWVQRGWKEVKVGEGQSNSRGGHLSSWCVRVSEQRYGTEGWRGQSFSKRHEWVRYVGVRVHNEWEPLTTAPQAYCSPCECEGEIERTCDAKPL